MATQTRALKGVPYSSRRYTMTEDESARWDSCDDCDRREILYALGERLMATAWSEGDCCVTFCHSGGHVVGKTVYHQPASRPSVPEKAPRRRIA